MYELQLVNNGFLEEYNENNRAFVESILLDSETLKRLNGDEDVYSDIIDVEFLSAVKKVDRVDTLVAVTSGFMVSIIKSTPPKSSNFTSIWNTSSWIVSLEVLFFICLLIEIIYTAMFFTNGLLYWNLGGCIYK